MTNSKPEVIPSSDEQPERGSPAPKPATARKPRVAGSKPAPRAAALPAERSIPEAAVTADGTTSRPRIDEDGTSIEADVVEVHRSAIGRVSATDVTVTQGAVGAASAARVSIAMGALGAAVGREVSISQGSAGTIVAREARVAEAFVRTMIARDVVVQRPSAVVFLLAQRVSGEVKVLLDWRGALALGAALGIVTSLFGRGAKGRGGKRS